MVRLVACLLLTLMPLGLGGCQGLPVFAASKPSVPSGAPTYGSLRGFVYGKDGRIQPLRGARVQAGPFTTLTGRPAGLYDMDLGGKAQHEHEGVVTVWHDFDDGHGPVPAERRSHAVLGSESEPYVYLRAGEFLIEGVPDGPVSLTAAICDMMSAPLSAHVTAGHTTDGLALALPLAVPVMNGDSTFPVVVTWHSSTPEDGFVVSVAPEGDRLTYAPSPPTLTVKLQAPVYSKGTTITGIEVEYVWRTAEGKTASLRSPRLPVAPLMVPPASETCPGAPVSLLVPLGTAELADAFIRQGAGQVVAKVRFIDEMGYEVQGMLLEALEVAVSLRKL